MKLMNEPLQLRIFYFNDYKKVIAHFIQVNESQRGYKSRLAEAAGCQNSYLSKVLSQAVHLTQDQGFGLSKFWNLMPVEEEYFLTLIQLERAGSLAYKNRLSEKLDELRETSQS